MPGPRQYRPADLKRLFALSGNQCAHPKCSNPVIAKDGETVIGKICHIHAANSLGARYDEKMSDNDRRHFDNLILLCDEDHSIIDNKDNEDEYPAPMLKRWKADHQTKNANSPSKVSKETVRQANEQLIVNARGTSIINNFSLEPAGHSVNSPHQRMVAVTSNVTNNYGQHHSELVEENIINEIFSHALEKLKAAVDVQEVHDQGKLLKVLEKIKLNFSKTSEQQEVRTYFTNSYQKKNMLEKHLETLEPELQLDLQNHIYGRYCDLRGTMDSLTVLRNLFKEYNPRVNDPIYLNVAQAYVLMFFEDCTIFEKTQQEVNDQTDLFSSL